MSYTFGPDGHLDRDTINRLAQDEYDADPRNEAEKAAARRRVLAYAVAPRWKRAWWRLRGRITA